ncbi:MAG: MFS transporter, partial [Rhodobacteraceae bacterium]|nr:MFS transporter [Paracoccaceae bacterium]
MSDADSPGDPLAVWLLAVGQTLGYAAMLYLFAAILTVVQADTGWSRATLALGPTVSLLVAAGAAPFAGRLVDAGHAARLLTWGAALGAASVAALALVTAPWMWVAVWAVIGLAYGASLYDVCFAFLTRRLGPGARAAITRVTLVAGFASTLAFPAGAGLAEAFGWRTAALVFAAVQLAATVPLNAWAATRLRRRERPPPSGPRDPETGALRAALRRPAFWGIAGALGLVSLNHGMLFTYALPLMQDRGAAPAMAVLAAACVGPAQVAGRIVLMLTESRVGVNRAAAAMMAGYVLGALALIAAGVAWWLVFAYAVAQGAAVGMMSILKPVIIAEV